MRVIISGPDLAGKTSIAKGLSEQWDIPLLHFGRQPDRAAMVQHVTRFFADPTVVTGNKNFILDRYYFVEDLIYEQVVWNKESELEPNIAHYFEMAFQHKILLCHITAEIEVLAARYNQRADEPLTLQTVLMIKNLFDINVYHWNTLYGACIFTLDTTNRTVRESMKLITDELIRRSWL